MTFVSEAKPTDVTDEMKLVHRKMSDANDVQSLASEITDVDLVVVGSDSKPLLLGHLARRELDPRVVVAGISSPAHEPAFEGTGVDNIDMSRLLAEQIRDRYE